MWALWHRLGEVERIIRQWLYRREVRRHARVGIFPSLIPAAEKAAAVVSIGFPLAVAAVLSLVTDIGDDFETPFYSALATLLPLLLVAGFVEAGISLTRSMESDSDADDSEAGRAVVSQTSGRLVSSVAVGEFAALWALASGSSSTFLAALAVLPLLRIAPELLRAHRARFEPLDDLDLDEFDQFLDEFDQFLDESDQFLDESDQPDQLPDSDAR